MKIRKELSLRIHELLINHEHLRDDDKRLVSTIWWHECGKKDITAFQLLDLIAKGHLSDYDGITRTRRKLQEKHEELRGNKWAFRHSIEDKVVAQINSL